ncbi:uncharacterized protein LOC126367488 [Pectinophora gossypiella]|uniref:uncharacterized protein LOC126367488 n=1 Tax=Pectinophora gossypiella TaxID=13191 RepID=UPI00214E9732|nr:uncharacterized protein LOC126367488 [Pectinophora gossypiella]XP_049866980.1 uncharacterized protein LOC126367488 [Pectinophora gossypiella]
MDIDADVNNVAYVEIIDDSQANNTESTTKDLSEHEESLNQEAKAITSEGNEKQCAVWTTDDTEILLKTYESKLEMLETPKKKTRIWIAISETLKQHNIEVTPDQVRWKINALAKKYKQCVESGEHEKFRYYKEMDNIYLQYNVECTDYSLLNAEKTDKRQARKRQLAETANATPSTKSATESKAMIELRKVRLANRIEADRSQSKISLEKQWLDYLKRQEEHKRWRDEIFERNLKLKEEELELRKKELAMKETLELQKLDLKERDQDEMLQIERQKCELLKRIFSHQNQNYDC